MSYAPKATRSVSGEILQETRGKKPTSGGKPSSPQGPDVEQAQLREQVNRHVSAMKKLLDPVDALPLELQPVGLARAGVEQIALRDPLAPKDVNEALQGVALVQKAIEDATKVVQTRLKQEVDGVVSQMNLLANPADANPDELQPVTQARSIVTQIAQRNVLAAKDVNEATQGLAGVQQAIAVAKQAVQTRLKLEVDGVISQMNLLANPADANPSELQGVTQARSSVSQIALRPVLAPKDVTEATQGLEGVRLAIENANKLVQVRLKQELAVVINDVKKLDDPQDANDNELQPVTQARTSVEQIALRDPLRAQDVVEATQGLAGVQQAIADAITAVQVRLRKELNGVITAMQQLPDWVDASLDLTDANLVRVKLQNVAAKNPLTPQDIDAAQELFEDVKVELSLAKVAVATRMREERATILFQLDGDEFKKPGGATDLEWEPVTEVSKAAKLILQAKSITPQVLDAARQKVVEAQGAATLATNAIRARLVQLRDEAIAAKKDTSSGSKKIPGEATKKLVAAVKSVGLESEIEKQVFIALKTDSTFVAYNALATKDVLGGIEAFQAELEAAIEAVVARAKALAESIKNSGQATAGPGVDDVLAATQRRLEVMDRYQELVALTKSESDLTKQAEAKAKAKYLFSTAMPEAQEELNSLALKFKTIHQTLDNYHAKDWPKAGFMQPIHKGDPVTVESADFALDFIKTKWTKAVLDRRAERELHSRDLDAKLKIYQSLPATNTRTAASEAESLGCILAFLKAGLSSKTAKARRADLSQGGKKYSLAVWETVLQRELDKQEKTPWSGEDWARCFGMGTIGKDNSWGIDNAGTVGGINCHLTYYPKGRAAAPSESRPDVLSKILGSGVEAIHVTQERIAKEDKGNPKYYRGGAVVPNRFETDTTLVDGLKAILDGYVSDFTVIIDANRTRHGLDETQDGLRRTYLKEISAELQKLL